jgi:MoxR-like ATPase
MEGTYPLPEAQLDRFFVKLRVEYPSRESMHTILDRTTGRQEVRAEKVLSSERLLQLRELVRDVPVARPVQDFAVRVVEGTHPTDVAGVPPLTKKYVRYGASPRGAQAILLAAKIKALLDGRFAVSTDDIRYVARPALRHRLILNFEGEAEGVDPDTIIDSILSETKP